MARKHEIFDRHGNPVDDDDAFDERGALRDGFRLRTSLMMRDGVSPLQRAVAEDAAASSLHRPGYRFAADAAGLEAKREAYLDMVKDMENAWRGPAQPAADVADYRKRKKTRQLDPHGRLVAEYETEEEEDDGMAMDAAEAQRIKDEAWLEMCDDLANAWKRKPPPSDAAANGGYGSGEFRGQRAGDACMTDDKEPGHLVAENGRLVCRADKRQDASPPPRTMSVADAQRVKDEAWREMVAEMENAWKGPGR